MEEPFDPECLQRIIVADLAPSSESETFLGVVRGFAGRTLELWTPIIVLLDLINAKRPTGRAQTIENVVDLGNTLTRACAFLYVAGGWHGVRARRRWQPIRESGALAVLGLESFMHLTDAGRQWLDKGELLDRIGDI